MENGINQIYHVSRCGSTLLSSLLSTVTMTYCEPSWQSERLEPFQMKKWHEKYLGSTVKLSSIYSCFPKPFPGPKVFLYRKLSHHLFKMMSCKKEWLEKKDRMYKQIKQFKFLDNLVSNYEVNDLWDKIIYIWILQIIQTKKDDGILWVETNDFLINKEEVLKNVCEHFSIPIVKDFSLFDIDVKKLNVFGKREPINHELRNVDKIKLVNHSHEIITKEKSLDTPSIFDKVETVKNRFPELVEFLY